MDLEARRYQMALAHQAYGIGANVGIALCTQCGYDPERLIKLADAAMYSVKNSGTGVYLDQTATGTNVFGNTFSNNANNFVNDGYGTITSAPSVVAVTVTSNPSGAGFVIANGKAGYAGSYSTTPYTFYATVGSSVTLTANTVNGYTFQGWSDSGAQTHTITVPSSHMSLKTL